MAPGSTRIGITGACAGAQTGMGTEPGSAVPKPASPSWNCSDPCAILRRSDWTFASPATPPGKVSFRREPVSVSPILVQFSP